MLSSGTSLTAPLAQANAIAMSLIKKPPEERVPFDFSPTQNLRSDNDSLNCSFSMREFQNSLDKTKNKSPGADMISKKMLPCLTDEKKGKILNLFNFLWSNSTVPESRRIAKIIPILKPGNIPTEFPSYRPSWLCCVVFSGTRAIFDYAVPNIWYIDVTKLIIDILQVIRNNIIRFAFGLPRWTPIPILHKVSNEINAPLRFDKRNMAFFIKQFSDRAFTEVSSSIKTVNSIISNTVYNRLPCGAKMERYSRLSNVQLDKIIPFAVPVDFEKCLNFVIRIRDFKFQHKNDNPNTIGIMFQDFKSHLNPDQIILATDASKTASSTAIAAINCSSKVVIKVNRLLQPIEKLQTEVMEVNKKIDAFLRKFTGRDFPTAYPQLLPLGIRLPIDCDEDLLDLNNKLLDTGFQSTLAGIIITLL
ncbi:hypothetical protein AVEN_67561-1 [Araneus ventricosus]|uniref:Uncharacterized protein n=1 Tax=Araneus ventricosus TaxID=182803 RepID=A0A4Y2MLG8_ARAVE|nr:hypothetical protein AVEN_67561-1 [Araneus ventricosus]